MEIILLIVHTIICIGIIALVLLQKSGGGALGIGGGQGGFISTRGVASLLTRLTAGLGAALFINSLLLASVMTRGNKSVFDVKKSKPPIEQKEMLPEKNLEPVLPDLTINQQSEPQNKNQMSKETGIEQPAKMDVVSQESEKSLKQNEKQTAPSDSTTPSPEKE